MNTFLRFDFLCSTRRYLPTAFAPGCLVAASVGGVVQGPHSLSQMASCGTEIFMAHSLRFAAISKLFLVC